LIGFCIAFVFYRGVWAKIAMTIIGLVGAVAIHSAFNLSVLSASPQSILSIFAWIWCAVIVIMILFEEIKAIHVPLSAT
jgi:hypothetical protein